MGPREAEWPRSWLGANPVQPKESAGSEYRWSVDPLGDVGAQQCRWRVDEAGDADECGSQVRVLRRGEMEPPDVFSSQRRRGRTGPVTPASARSAPTARRHGASSV